MRKQQQEYEDIDRLSSDAKKQVELKSRELMVGKVQWCPHLTKAIAQIQYWKGINK